MISNTVCEMDVIFVTVLHCYNDETSLTVWNYHLPGAPSAGAPSTGAPSAAGAPSAGAAASAKECVS